jgi:single-strand DNA-binding protein
MNQGGYVTLVGFVAQDPKQRLTKDGTRVTDLRVGATTRVQDRATNEWRDADTSYYDVTCWRRLGDHVRASMHKGEPVFVKGRFKSRSYEDKNGQLNKVISIVADTVGHDLNRGPANYMRREPARGHRGNPRRGRRARRDDRRGSGRAVQPGPRRSRTSRAGTRRGRGG